MTKILIVDDDKELTDLLKEFLEKFKYTLTVFHNPLDALDYLKADPEKATEPVRNEQEYITQFVDRQNRLKYWPEKWCRSFKRHCIRPFPLSFFQQPRIPDDARVIIFHGKPHPDDALAGRSGKWYRKVLPTRWIAEYWQ